MVVVMSQFHNGGQNTSNVALTTQADRSVYLPYVPKVSTRGRAGLQAAGLNSDTAESR